MPLPHSPEFENVDFDPTHAEQIFDYYQDGHVPTTLGIVVNDRGSILTFDAPQDTVHENKRVILPEATIKARPRDADAVREALLRRFGVRGHGRIIGDKALLASRISFRQTPRLFVPVEYVDTDEISAQPLAVRGVRPTKLWRTAQSILDILEEDDALNGHFGSQRRGITRAAIEMYQASV